MSLNVTLVDVSETRHEGQVYEHYLVVELPGGVEMGLFDPDMLVDPSMVGEDIDILIGTLTSPETVSKLEEAISGIEPSSEDTLGTTGHMYYGDVVEIEEANETTFDIRLNVGEGTVAVRPSKKSIRPLEVGDHLQVEAIRSDVWEVINP